MSDQIIVTGAAGHLGRAVIHHLLESQKINPKRIVAASRDPGKLSDLKAKGIELRRADFDDAASLAEAFRGGGHILIISTDSLDSGGRLRQHLAAVKAAKEAGAARIYYTSMPRPEPGSPVLFAGDHWGTEEAIRATGLPYTIFRNGWYQENLLMGLPGAFAHGAWATSAGDGRVAYVARDDIAAAIAGGLASPAKGSVVYTLTGDVASTVDEIAAAASKTVGKPLQVVKLSDDAYLEMLKSVGLPEGFAKLLVSFDANTRGGGLSDVTGDVANLSGRKLSPLSRFLEANKAALAGA